MSRFSKTLAFTLAASTALSTPALAQDDPSAPPVTGNESNDEEGNDPAEHGTNLSFWLLTRHSPSRLMLKQAGAKTKVPDPPTSQHH